MTSQNWYIVRQSTGHCEIVTESDLHGDPADYESLESETPERGSPMKRWGPLSSRNEAIAKRVGLIRSGQCKPS
ncbi:hypothetical protein [Alkalinema sp. FACHB-956]|uniref:hypothetical protein n=1 Tax=Alkalinema sp. FACHB-956 TaxID=2692768 RepID=UPI0016854797|nr:hypothetical protein [Alkalinema sp. FACHB-956]MBD2329859.1 hypothetical protein [Alkalinema sp. FACHB-956]